MSAKNKNIVPKVKTSSKPVAPSVQSLFDGSKYEVNEPSEMSEFDKVYNGRPSKLDTICFSEEYNKPKRKKIQKDFFADDRDFFSNEIEESFEIRPNSAYNSLSLAKQAPNYRNKEQMHSRNQNDGEKKDIAVVIAEDFIKWANLIMVGSNIYIYNGKFYSQLSEDMAMRLIFQRYYDQVSHANASGLTKNAVAVLKLCITTQLDEFPDNSHIIVFENGTLEVDTGKFRNNSPEDIASSALGISYDPERQEMPNTKRFLKTIAAGDDELYELMLQVIGYILSNDIRAKSFFYLEGVGDAGKSRFCDLIASFFPSSGPNKVARVALQDLGGKFAMGNLVNTKLNISEDLPDSPLTPTTVSRIKMLSDANRLEAEAKYVQAFSFRPKCKLLFASNHPLRIKEYDAAFINRVVYIPFLKSIPKSKQDRNILSKMQEELPALFNHAFAAYKRLVANRYAWAGEERFKPEICVIKSGISIDKELVLRHFADTCCIFGESYTISISELQEAYQLFCQQNGYVAVAGDRFSREIYAVLPKTVTRIKIRNQRRGFKGIKLKSIFE